MVDPFDPADVPPPFDELPPEPGASGFTGMADSGADSAMPRRDFLRIAGVGGAFLATGCATGAAAGGNAFATAKPVNGIDRKAARDKGVGHVVVIGAGAWGGWTAYHLRERGAQVTLIDAYGPGNSRST